MKKKNVILGYILGLLLVFPIYGEAHSSESTRSGFLERNGINPKARCDDGTCGSYRRDLSCHSGIRYNLTFLMAKFEKGECRPDPKDMSDDSFKKCDALPRSCSPEIEKEITSAITPTQGTYPLTRPSGALHYADELTACASYGKRSAYSYARKMGRSSGAGYCAVGVRSSLACMARKFGRKVDDFKFHCGGNAGAYYGCLEKKGFVRDMKRCNQPGIIRVYYGHRQGRSQRKGKDNSGDVNGHIEFLGTDGMWHAGTESALPINQRYGRGRRILKGCYYYTGGSQR